MKIVGIVILVFVLSFGVSVSAHSRSGGGSGTGGGGKDTSSANLPITVNYPKKPWNINSLITEEKLETWTKPDSIDKNIRNAISYMENNSAAGENQTKTHKDMQPLPGSLRSYRELLTLYHGGSEALEKRRKNSSEDSNLIMFQFLIYHHILNGKK